MARRKPKRKRAPKNPASNMLREINATTFTGSELMEFANEVQKLNPEHQCFEGRVAVASDFFSGDFKRVSSALFRMEALARMISHARLEGWVKRSQIKGMFLTNTALFEAAGQVPLRFKDNKIEFTRATLLKKVFQVANLHKG